MTRCATAKRSLSAEELHARVGPPTWCRMRIRRPILWLVNCSEFFRNVTVFAASNLQLEGYISATTSSISSAHGVIACPFIVMPEAV
jgi:hypothetical protein